MGEMRAMRATEEAPSSAPPSGRAPRRSKLLTRIADIGTSAQAAIPGLYAWAITVAPAAWSRGAPVLAKVAAVLGVLALVTAPLVEGSPKPSVATTAGAARAPARGLAAMPRPMRARILSVWGACLSSALVWALVPSALSAARLDGVRGALGIVGWALFAFASAGPVLRPEPESAKRVARSTSLKPRSELPRGDGLYVAIGIALALTMQVVGWGVVAPERAVLVRLVTVVCGIAVVTATTSISLARHAKRKPAPRRLRLRRALPWLAMLVMVGVAGYALTLAR